MTPRRKRVSLHDKSALDLIEQLYPSALLAADSKLHLRSWMRPHENRKEFRGLIGSVLYIKKPKEFAKWYNITISSLFKKFEIERDRCIYKSSQIATEFPSRPKNFLYFLNDFIRELFQVDKKILPSINIYPFTLDTRMLEKTIPEPLQSSEGDSRTRKMISAYAEEGGRLISISDLFKTLENYFPAICVWKISGVLNISREEVLLDGCQGPVSKAWRELLNRCRNVSILYHGDEYSPFISSADLLVRWVDESLKQSKYPLHRDSLEKLLHNWGNVTEEIDTTHVYHKNIWNPDLAMVVPISKRKIQRFEGHFAKRPITFLVHETNNSDFSDKSVFNESPLYNALVRDLYQSGGSYVWFDMLCCTIVQIAGKSTILPSSPPSSCHVCSVMPSSML